jgi:exonuclease SbcC
MRTGRKKVKQVKLKTLHLKNIKSYEDETINFYDGVNFISGINGAGKSTIIESIGFALFDSKPGVLNEFVRYGAKTGVITLEFEAADERLYRIVRKVGSVSSWVVYDGESGQEIDLHGAADIKPWLKNILGLEQDQDLAQLFADVVGVSQGTFTAPFLDRPADRRQKFNRMLQVETYNEAYVKTREVNSFLLEQVKEQENKRERLLGQTENYEGCKLESEKLQIEVANIEAQLKLLQEKLGEIQKERDLLRQIKEDIQQNKQTLSVIHVELKTLGEQREECVKSLKQANEAAKIADGAKEGYEKYLTLQKALNELEEKNKEKIQLEKKLSQLVIQLNAIKAEYETLQNTLTEQKNKNLEQLQDYEKRLLALNRQLSSQEETYTLVDTIANNGQQFLEEVKRGLTVPGQLEVLGQRIQTGLEKWKELKEEIQGSEKKLKEFGTLEQQAKEIKKVQEELQKARLELAALWEKARSLRESKEQVKDGLCPHLHEPCQNIKGNLQEYFAKQLEQVSNQVAATEKKVNHLEKVYQEGESVFHELQALQLEQDKLKSNLIKEETYRQTFFRIWQDSLQFNLQGDAQKLLEVGEKLLHLKQKATGESNLSFSPELSRAYEKLILAWQEFKTDFQLSEDITLEKVEVLLSKMAKLIGDSQDFQNFLSEFAEEVRDHISTAKNRVYNQLSALKVEQKNLNEQFSQLQKAQEQLLTKVKSLEEKKLAIGKMEGEEISVKEQLKQYEGIEGQLERVRQDLANSEESYRLFLKYQEEANKVTELESKLIQIKATEKEKLDHEERLISLLSKLESDFSAEKLNALEEEVEKRQQELSKTQANLTGKKEKLQELEGQLAKMEEARRQISLIEKTLVRYQRVKAMLDFVRSIFNRAGEKVATVYREYLAQEASRIYREVARENVSLEWQQDYEVVLVDQIGDRKRERSFRQLSGGEQMTAALAVRLALLKQLAGIQVGFFDEPTTNLDSERRNYLASVIPKITKTFDQLFIISHDDSFDAMTDNIIELSKDTGSGTKLKQSS